jgi:hypothetical protein
MFSLHLSDCITIGQVIFDRTIRKPLVRAQTFQPWKFPADTICTLSGIYAVRRAELAACRIPMTASVVFFYSVTMRMTLPLPAGGAHAPPLSRRTKTDTKQ